MFVNNTPNSFPHAPGDDVMDRDLEMLAVLLDPCLTLDEATREASARRYTRDRRPKVIEVIEPRQPRPEWRDWRDLVTADGE